MGCCHSRDLLDQYNRSLSEFPSLNQSEEHSHLAPGTITKLKKGGVIISTKIGDIQFGMPPETLKDALQAGLPVPTIYILPTQRFDKEKAVCCAEFEFPAFYNFFVCKKGISVITDKKGEEACRKIFQETLQGPKDLSNFKNDFDRNFDPELIPDIKAELAHFAKNSGTEGKNLTFDCIIKIILFDKDNIAELGEGVCIKKRDSHVLIYQDNKEIVKIKDKISVDPEEYESSMSITREHLDIIKNTIDPYKKRRNSGNGEPINSNEDKEKEADIHKTQAPIESLYLKTPIEWNPPDFGITFLGTSHGFDHCDACSGHIIWINGKGIMVDPPPFSMNALKTYGIPPCLIDKVIVTHCHADHDAGVFNKVLIEAKIELIATPTIMGSWLRKYSAVLGMSEQELQTLFEYRPIIIGEPQELSGAKLHFFYSLHSIPCIGYEIEYNGKWIYFSGDTFYDPEGLKLLHEEGVLGKKRFEQLANRDWDKYDCIQHESGVPPIHTPTKLLGNLPEIIKEKLWLYHISDKAVPPDLGLKKGVVGPRNTIILVERNEQNCYWRNLEQLSGLELFSQMPFRRISDLLKCLQIEKYEKNDLICKKGSYGDKFYIIKSGIIKVYNKEDKSKEFEKFYFTGDFFGESAITGDGLRLANVLAHTKSEVFVLTTLNFKWIFGPNGGAMFNQTKVMDLMSTLNSIRKGEYAEFINNNKFISKMTESQKNDINVRLKEVNVNSGEVLWKVGDTPTYCFFICSGRFLQQGPGGKANCFNLIKGQLVGDFPHLIQSKVCVSCQKCVESGQILVFDKDNFIQFLSKNPGLYVFLKDKIVVE